MVFRVIIISLLAIDTNFTINGGRRSKEKYS